MAQREIDEWAELHRHIVAAARDEEAAVAPLLQQERARRAPLAPLLDELNDRVFRALGLRDFERALVRDLVHLRVGLIQGKVSEKARQRPSSREIRRYAKVLTDELDAFVDDRPSLKHSTTVFDNGNSAIVAIRLHTSRSPNHRIRVERADSRAAKVTASIRSRVRQQHSQWIYFERNLLLYEGRNTYLFKPLERLHWTESQAILDAGTVIAKTLA